MYRDIQGWGLGADWSFKNYQKLGSRFRGSGFGVWGLGFGVQGLGLRIWDLGFGV